MSKGWPDPLHDSGDDFWDFDSMSDEYEWEQKRKIRKAKQQKSPAPPVRDTPEESPRTVLIAFLVMIAILITLIAGCRACNHAAHQKWVNEIERARSR